MFALAQAYRENRKRFVIGAGVLVLLLIGLNAGGNVESRVNRSQFELTIGSLLMQERKVQQAIPYFEEALLLVPESGAACGLLGNAYLEAGRTAEAESVYTAAVARFPGYHQYNFGLGQVQEASGKVSEAKESYREVLRYAKNHAPAAERLARIFEAEGVLDSALFYYEWVKRYAKPNPRLNQKIEDLRNQSSL